MCVFENNCVAIIYYLLKPGFQVCWIHADLLTFASPVTRMPTAGETMTLKTTPASANKGSQAMESKIARVCHLFHYIKQNVKGTFSAFVIKSNKFKQKRLPSSIVWVVYKSCKN